MNIEHSLERLGGGVVFVVVEAGVDWKVPDLAALARLQHADVEDAGAFGIVGCASEKTAWGRVSLLTKVAARPVKTTSTLGITPLEVIVTT